MEEFYFFSTKWFLYCKAKVKPLSGFDAPTPLRGRKHPIDKVLMLAPELRKHWTVHVKAALTT